jgi:hypothetical protein
MAQISQNPDGTYSRSYSNTELTLIKSLQEEIKIRQAGDQELWADMTTLGNRVEALEEGRFSLSELQEIITKNITTLDKHDARLLKLEESVIVDAYSKKEMNQLLIPWKIEQIAHTFDIPEDHMFDKANLDDIRVGYKHYNHADINEPYDNHIPENTMQRYTINAFASTPKVATFNIHYADHCVVLVDGVVHETYIDVGGNFGKAAKTTSIDLKEGWTQIRFLVANETQAGGLVVQSDLYEKADYLTNFDYTAGMISGDRIQAGSLNERHFSPNMDLVVHTIHATATEVPGVIIGNANERGAIQIGDGTLSKAKDEPFYFDDGIRVNGYIRVTQLLIDKDFIRAGDGMIVNTIKDEFGYTKMYEIINDVRVVNGGGMNITGNAQDGYQITNDLQIHVNEEGGLAIEGDAIRGYTLTNTMILGSKGGIEVTGNATKGYDVRNTMKLTSDYGIVKIEGNAWTGYTIKNVLEILAGGGIKLEGSIDSGEITVVNDMTLLEKTTTGSVKITGDAPTGYYIEGLWPNIEGIGDVEVTDDGKGNYDIKVDVHVKDVLKRAESENFITVYDSGDGKHQLGIDDTIFYNRVKDIVLAEAQTEVKSDIDFIEILNEDTLAIPDFNKMIPWIQKGQSPLLHASPSGSPNIQTGGWFNESNPQFIETTSNNWILSSFFAGHIPAMTANCIRLSTQGGWEGSSSAVEMKLKITVHDSLSGGTWEKIFTRTITGSLSSNASNYNEMIHTVPVPTRDYWRHYDVECSFRRASGTGKANAKFREVWTDNTGLGQPHDSNGTRTE